MPSATGKFTGPGLAALLAGAPWGSDDFYYALIDSTGNSAINIDSTDFWDDLVANEKYDGANWPQNGVQASGETLSLVTANNDVEFDITDISQGTVTLTDAKAGILYSRTPGSNAAREVVGYSTFDTALAPQGGTLVIDFASTGFALIDYT